MNTTELITNNIGSLFKTTTDLGFRREPEINNVSGQMVLGKDCYFTLLGSVEITEVSLGWPKNNIFFTCIVEIWCRLHWSVFEF